MKNLKKQKGITLIALIITIIVLLILAGVTINMLLGENGILKNAKIAAEQYAIAQGKERIELILAQIEMEEITTGTEKSIDEITGILESKDGIKEAEKIDDNTIKVTTDEGYEYEVTIDEEGKTKVEYVGESAGGEETTPPDEVAPEVSIEVKETNAATAILTVIATDEGSGLAQSGTYKYYLGEELKQTSTTNGYVYTNLEENTGYTLKVIVTDKVGNEGTKTVDITTKSIVPTNYVASSVDKENTIEDGLVIYEGTEAVTSSNHPTALTDRNQYVWIPVADINSMSMCKSNAEGSVCNLEIQTDRTLKCTVHADTATEIVGRLYTDVTTSSTTEQNSAGTDVRIYSRIINFNQTNQTYNANSGWREPGVVTGNNEGTGTEYDGDTTNNYHGYGTASAFLQELEEEYIKMATSVAKNGGFYVARYEMQANGVSKKNQTVLNSGTNSANMWYGLYNIAKTANPTLNSHMVWRKSV